MSIQFGMVYRRVGRQEFLDTLAAAKRERGAQGLCVCEPDPGAVFYIAGDGQSGYALQGDVFCGVFSLTKGRLEGMVKDAMRRLVGLSSYIRLDCFEPLAGVYARHGFVEHERVPFDWQYAPDGWSAEHGEPDVVFMHRSLYVWAALPKVGVSVLSPAA